MRLSKFQQWKVTFTGRIETCTVITEAVGGQGAINKAQRQLREMGAEGQLILVRLEIVNALP